MRPKSLFLAVSLVVCPSFAYAADKAPVGLQGTKARAQAYIAEANAKKAAGDLHGALKALRKAKAELRLRETVERLVEELASTIATCSTDTECEELFGKEP